MDIVAIMTGDHLSINGKTYVVGSMEGSDNYKNIELQDSEYSESPITMYYEKIN